MRKTKIRGGYMQGQYPLKPTIVVSREWLIKLADRVRTRNSDLIRELNTRLHHSNYEIIPEIAWVAEECLVLGFVLSAGEKDKPWYRLAFSPREYVDHGILSEEEMQSILRRAAAS